MMKKALIICSEYPYPMNSGDKLSTNGYVLALRKMGLSVDLLCFACKGDSERSLEKRDLLQNVFFVEKPPKYSFDNMMRFIFRRESFLFGRFFSRENQIKIERILADGRYGYVVVVQTYMGQYLSEATVRRLSCPVVLSTEVLHGRALAKRAALEENSLKRKVLQIESKRADKKEKRIVQAYDMSFFYAEEDEEHMSGVLPRERRKYINLALDLESYTHFARNRNGKRRSIAFYGTCSWYANADALRYLLEKLWSEIREVCDVELHIAGRNMCPWAYDYQKSDSRIKIFGEVPSMADFVADTDIILSPIRIGGGVRLKMIEGMMWGRPIVSTIAGVEGIAEDEDELHECVSIADDPKAFAQAVKGLLDSEEQWQHQVDAAYRYVQKKHSIDVLRRILSDISGNVSLTKRKGDKR